MMASWYDRKPAKLKYNSSILNLVNEIIFTGFCSWTTFPRYGLSHNGPIGSFQLIKAIRASVQFWSVKSWYCLEFLAIRFTSRSAMELEVFGVFQKSISWGRSQGRSQMQCGSRWHCNLQMELMRVGNHFLEFRKCPFSTGMHFWVQNGRPGGMVRTTTPRYEDVPERY